MIILERQIQKTYPGKWEELDEIDKKFNAIEKEYRFPPKKRYTYFSTTYDSNTIIIEREWQSFTIADATYEKANRDPEYQKLVVALGPIIKSSRLEFYTPRP